jgi:predicted ATPase
MGLHTGEGLVLHGDYNGHDVDTAKRVCDAAHGGQILLSQTTADLIGTDARLTNLGVYRLKDLDEAEGIFQVIDEGGQIDLPALRSPGHFTNNLPLQRSTFVGREREIAEVRKLLDDHRLVTVTGIGGCGKTRLALQVGVELLDANPDGVSFVDLGPISSADAIVPAIASAAGLPLGGDIGTGAAPATPADAALVGFLSQRQCLVILDNCEHILDACAEIAERILGGCPQVTLLATSREGLAVQGEQLWQIPPLSLPADGEDAETSEAVRLFNARAKAVRASFELTPDNIGAVSEICRRLDGIPLAIEFAAARISHLPPTEIADRLGDMFRLLGGGRGRVQRQQTLQGALDWSYELLSEDERVLLRRLSVFAGSFTIPAVEGICSGADVEEHSVLDRLASLVAKSLVVLGDEGPEARYRLLETVRLYASEQLRGAGEADAFRARHRDWFEALAESCDWEDCLFPLNLRRSVLALEPSNLRAALEFSEAEGRLDSVIAMAARLGNLWISAGLLREAYGWLTKARPEDLELKPEERAAALSSASLMAGRLHESAFSDLAERAVASAGDTPSVPLIRALGARAINSAVRSQSAGDIQLGTAARSDLDRAQQLAEHFSDRARSYVLQMRVMVELVLGDMHTAREACDAAVALDPGDFLSWGHLAATSHLTGDHERALEAVTRYADVVLTQRRLDLGIATPAVLVAMAGAGQPVRALELLAEQLDLLERDVQPMVLEQLMVGYAAIAYLLGDYPRCSRLFAWVRARTFDRGRDIPSVATSAVYRHYVALVRRTLDRDAARQYREDGQAMSERDAIACAKSGPSPGI